MVLFWDLLYFLCIILLTINWIYFSFYHHSIGAASHIINICQCRHIFRKSTWSSRGLNAILHFKAISCCMYFMCNVLLVTSCSIASATVHTSSLVQMQTFVAAQVPEVQYPKLVHCMIDYEYWYPSPIGLIVVWFHLRLFWYQICYAFGLCSCDFVLYSSWIKVQYIANIDCTST